MIERFQDEEGRRRLLAALVTHRLLNGSDEIAEMMICEGELFEFSSGQILIQDQGSDNQIYFIITGEVSVLVNGREVALRRSGTHVGEMAMIDPTARRCATVTAVVDTVALRINEPAFAAIANAHPMLWRGFAIELADRLRQRNLLVMTPNPRPALFIGSSVESLPIARAIQKGLKHDNVRINVWTDGVFGASRFPINDLQTAICHADFGLLVIAPEDQVYCRGDVVNVPRDNVVFELGMCMGALLRERTFMVLPRSSDIKIPTDLLGLTPLDYYLGPEKDFDSALAPVCEDLRRIISTLGTK